MKICLFCHKELPLDFFYDSPRGKFGKQSYCKLCHNLRSTKWRENNREKANGYSRDAHRRDKVKNAPAKREWWYKSQYGMTEPDYQKLVVIQGNRCLICEEKSDKRLYVDHDHKTGKVRGLLCNRCNAAIGLMKDDSWRLARAIMYLSK
jgi:hypothetical protein